MVKVSQKMQLEAGPANESDEQATELRERDRSHRDSRERKRSRSRSPSESQERQLLAAWDRTGTTGRRREILEKAAETTGTAMSEANIALLCFLADERMTTLPTVKTFVFKNESKEKRGKTFDYERESKQVREGLDISRRFE